MKLAILGIRGIPNHHGGFEQFAEYFSVHMAEKGHEVYVYNSHSHPYQKDEYKGVHILHRYDPENSIGTFGQFIYDLNCILDSKKRKFDVILQLGYTSSSVWGWLLPKKSVIVTNMDGLEWKRSKYSKPVRSFLKRAEKWAIRTSDFFIADSVGIQDFLKQKYGVRSKYIPYGADQFDEPDLDVLKLYGVDSYRYNMLIARLEPENNIETILDGISGTKNNMPFLVIGKHETKYGNYLKTKFADHSHIRFIGGIYNLEHLNNLRYFSNLYFHGHSVGGTNPSLLEAMASQALIIAHDNIFNKSILGKDSFYFQNSNDVSKLLEIRKTDYKKMIASNFKKIKEIFAWQIINESYEAFLNFCWQNRNSAT